MKLEVKCKLLEGSDDKYDLKLHTYKETIHTTVDKENLRYLLEAVDNAIRP
jgi:hypothetical protein